MFSETYPALYRDRFGEVATTVQNNGKELRMKLRGVEFTGRHLNDWEPDDQADMTLLQQFPLHSTFRELSDYTLIWEMPVPVIVQTERLQGMLHVHLVQGAPRPRGEEVHLRLVIAGSSFSSHPTDDFECALLDLATQLPEGISIQTCFFCAFSDYSPSGKDMFGDLACFRDNKQQYLAVRSKWDLFAIWRTQTEGVQETYHCREFAKRKPGTGYRG